MCFAPFSNFKVAVALCVILILQCSICCATEGGNAAEGALACSLGTRIVLPCFVLTVILIVC